MTRDSDAATLGPRLDIADALGIGLLMAVLLMLATLRARHTMFWADEMMGLYVLRAPNLHEALHLWRDGIDSSGIWFVFLGRAWNAIFGTSEMGLRIFSACGVALSAATLWITARRLYSFWPVAAAVTFIYSAVGTLRWQLDNGRTYGLFLFACTLVLYLLVRGEDADTTKPSAGFLLATLLAYSFLAGTHVLGLFWVFAFLGIQIALDVRPAALRPEGQAARRLRPLLYLAAACSVGVFVASLGNLRSDTALTKPTYWTKRPTFHDLLTSGILINEQTLAVIGVLLVAVLVLRPRLQRERVPAYAILLGFLCIDLFLFVLSRVATSVYVNRYLLPMSFAAVLLLCELLTQLRDARGPAASLRAAAPALFLAMAAALFFVPRLQRAYLPFHDYTPSLLAATPQGMPIVIRDPEVFVEMEWYHHNDPGPRLLYPTDWPVALDKENLSGVSGAHEMDNFKMDGIYSADILPTASVLALSGEFAVIAPPDDLWMKRRIFANPHLAATRTGTFTIAKIVPLEIWRVQTR